MSVYLRNKFVVEIGSKVGELQVQEILSDQKFVGICLAMYMSIRDMNYNTFVCLDEIELQLVP